MREGRLLAALSHSGKILHIFNKLLEFFDRQDDRLFFTTFVGNILEF